MFFYLYMMVCMNTELGIGGLMTVLPWNSINEDERNAVIRFVESNLQVVRRDILEKDPNLYAGTRAAEVAPGWVIIRGIDYVRDFMKKER